MGSFGADEEVAVLGGAVCKGCGHGGGGGGDGGETLGKVDGDVLADEVEPGSSAQADAVGGVEDFEGLPRGAVEDGEDGVWASFVRRVCLGRVQQVEYLLGQDLFESGLRPVDAKVPVP